MTLHHVTILSIARHALAGLFVGRAHKRSHTTLRHVINASSWPWPSAPQAGWCAPALGSLRPRSPHRTARASGWPWRASTHRAGAGVPSCPSHTARHPCARRWAGSLVGSLVGHPVRSGSRYSTARRGSNHRAAFASRPLPASAGYRDPACRISRRSMSPYSRGHHGSPHKKQRR